MTEPKRISLFWLLFGALIAVTIVFDIAYADEGHGHNHDSTDTVDASSVVNNSISDTSRAFGFGFGDVAITQCYRSYQILIWQDSKINPICLADSLDAKGLHHTAAMIRCDIKAIRKHFDSDKSCIQATTMQMIHPVVIEEPVNDDEYREQQQTYMVELESRMDRMESARQSANRYAASEKQKEQQAETDRKEYAQQMYEELKEWN